MDKAIPKIFIKDISFYYDHVPVLDQVSFSIEEGQTLIIAGKSGSGKSTLLEISAGLLSPHSGTVTIDGKNIAEMGQTQLTGLRKHMGFVFQKHALISNMPAAANIALPLRYHLYLPALEMERRVGALLDLFGISAVAGKLPEALSVGQARCVSIARALVMDPDMLFLDEPTAGLDPVTTQSLINVLNEIRRRKNLTILMVSHDVLTMSQLKSPLVILDNGRLISLEEARTSLQAPEIVSYFKEAL
jgi:ABC-type methionine transport system ATPase subunit